MHTTCSRCAKVERTVHHNYVLKVCVCVCLQIARVPNLCSAARRTSGPSFRIPCQPPAAPSKEPPELTPQAHPSPGNGGVRQKQPVAAPRLYLAVELYGVADDHPARPEEIEGRLQVAADPGLMRVLEARGGKGPTVHCSTTRAPDGLKGRLHHAAAMTHAFASISTQSERHRRGLPANRARHRHHMRRAPLLARRDLRSSAGVRPCRLLGARVCGTRLSPASVQGRLMSGGSGSICFAMARPGNGQGKTHRRGVVGELLRSSYAADPQRSVLHDPALAHSLSLSLSPSKSLPHSLTHSPNHSLTHLPPAPQTSPLSQTEASTKLATPFTQKTARTLTHVAKLAQSARARGQSAALPYRKPPSPWTSRIVPCFFASCCSRPLIEPCAGEDAKNRNAQPRKRPNDAYNQTLGAVATHISASIHGSSLCTASGTGPAGQDAYDSRINKTNIGNNASSTSCPRRIILKDESLCRPV